MSTAPFACVRTLRSRCRYYYMSRSFSSSPRIRSNSNHYFPPPFAPTASPSLDAILDTIRRKVLLVRHLDKRQRRLAQDPSQRTTLLTEEVLVALDGQEVRLEPLANPSGVSSRKSFLQALDESLRTGDFGFWNELLQGYRGARLRLKSEVKEKWARKLTEAGAVTTVMAALGRVQRTAFNAEAGIIQLVALGVWNEAMFTDQLRLTAELLADADLRTRDTAFAAIMEGRLAEEMPERKDILGKSYARGFKQAMELNLILSRDGHIQRQWTTEDDPRLDPLLVAVPLDFRCRLEKYHPELLVKHTSTASELASRLLNTIAARPMRTDIQKHQVSDPSKAEANAQRELLKKCIIIASSLRSAKLVVKDQELAAKIQKELSDVENLVEESDLFGSDFLQRAWRRYQNRQGFALLQPGAVEGLKARIVT